jgi:glycosyltransferase involved in cell wall biosynthesis
MESSSGPNSFGKRLAMALFEAGHVVELEDGTNSDVSIVFIEPSGRHLAKKVIQRLDGIWFSPSEFDTKNVKIKSLYQNADGVIWQSEFDKQMVTKWWGKPKAGAVIHNGISAPEIKNFTISSLVQLRQQYEMIFVCSANWHPQKRLQDNIAIFKHIRKFYSSAALIVMGSNPMFVADPHIFYTGSQPHEVCLEVFSAADWMIHLAWLDHCPNTVVEALSQNTPVICSEHGGTKELIKNFGIILKESQEYNFDLVDYNHPPKIDMSQLLEKLPEISSLKNDVDVSLSSCLNKYLNFIGNV